jgi:hypothetical protein
MEIFTYDRSASRLEPVEIEAGNVRSELRRAVDLARPLPSRAEELLAHIRQHCPETVAQWTADGLVSFRLHGLEFARQASGAESLVAPFLFGVDQTQPLTPAAEPDFTSLLQQLTAQRHARGNRRDHLYALQPERWMEERLRADIQRLSPALDPRFVYEQVPVCRAAHRDLLDLLAITREGRLAIVELKADEDIGFPLQALDYWKAVRYHQQRGDFERLGYFPGMQIADAPPLLYLVAPALRWHPRSDDVLRWISPAVPCVRVEINEDWRNRIEVLDRRQHTNA